ncbi:MAG: peptide chain release factor 1 [Omnitrophica bacterium GWA2_52_12]|nr:MAG: peptide chain release factor 1 [Omnitrophica bacterium GWA2_52_12]
MLALERIKKLEERYGQIQHDLAGPDAAKDAAKFQKLSKELARLRPVVEAFEVWRRVDKEFHEAEKGLKEPGLDAEMERLYRDEISRLGAQKQKLQTELEDMLLKGSDPNAGRDIILEIRAGTGGEEAALFGADLFRMYSRYAADHGLKVEVMDENSTGKGGFKEMIAGVTGADAYSLFKFESGIHRVQRVPETEASGRVHTSAVTVAVLVEAEEEEFKIDPDDLRIDVYRASGAGGQHVNKTESAVRITHIPTGFVISCQDERSQHKNKAKAMRVLRARLFEMKQLQEAKEQAEIRKAQVGSGDRSGKIRTYNFSERRVTDHRIGLTLHSLDDILNGHLDPIVQALHQHERTQKLIHAA